MPADGTFYDLAEALTEVMGWTGTCAIGFYFEEGSKKWWPDLDEEALEDPLRLLMTTPVSERLEAGLVKFEFEFDNDGYVPRDGWLHLVEYEGSLPERDQGQGHAGSGWRGLTRCIAGERVCPPNRIGKAAGYARLLEGLRRLDAELFLFRTNDIETVESCIKATLKRTQIRPHREVYQLDLDTLKAIIHGCDELRGLLKLEHKAAGPGKLTGGCFLCAVRDGDQ